MQIILKISPFSVTKKLKSDSNSFFSKDQHLEWNRPHLISVKDLIILNKRFSLVCLNSQRPNKKPLYKPNRDIRILPTVPPTVSCTDSCVTVPTAHGTTAGQAGGRNVQGRHLSIIESGQSVSSTHDTCCTDIEIPSEQQHQEAKSSTTLS